MTCFTYQSVLKHLSILDTLTYFCTFPVLILVWLFCVWIVTLCIKNYFWKKWKNIIVILQYLIIFYFIYLKFRGGVKRRTRTCVGDRYIYIFWIKYVWWEYSLFEKYFMKFYKGKFLNYSLLLAVLPWNRLDPDFYGN